MLLMTTSAIDYAHLHAPSDRFAPVESLVLVPVIVSASPACHGLVVESVNVSVLL
jgi:hypothetical protein